jgi:hypothetical protein
MSLDLSHLEDLDAPPVRERKETNRESKIENAVCGYADRKGMWVRKFVSPGRRSAPDRIFGFHGRVFWIEFKAPGKKPTPLQAAEHEKMRKHGLTVYVCDSITSGKKVIDDEIAGL